MIKQILGTVQKWLLQTTNFLLIVFTKKSGHIK